MISKDPVYSTSCVRGLALIKIFLKCLVLGTTQGNFNSSARGAKMASEFPQSFLQKLFTFAFINDDQPYS